MYSQMAAAQAFLKSFTIHNADVVCSSCGWFCHGVGALGTYIILSSETGSMISALNQYGVTGINKGFAEIKLPYRLEVWIDESKGQINDRMLETEAAACTDYFHLVTPTDERYNTLYKGFHPIAFTISGRIGEIETEYRTEPKYEQIGSETEEYDEPVYTTVKKYRTEKYMDKERRSATVNKPRKITKTIKKVDVVPIYNTWSKKWETREYPSYFTKEETEPHYVTEYYDHPVEKTRQVPYEEKVQNGTRRAYRQVPKYGYVDRQIPYRYCKPVTVPCYIYMIPTDKCNNCQCEFCRRKLVATTSEFQSLINQWCEYFKNATVTSCLVCGIDHTVHNPNNSLYLIGSNSFQLKENHSTHEHTIQHPPAL